ncbi:MAG: agmatine deiminase family protein, partial [Cyclobacteriaceae bacterium]
RNRQGKQYRLVALPMAEATYNEAGNRLPATYANFLITNKKVLVPIYGTTTDQQALNILSALFTDREVVGINCNALIKQHGSLHCITMQIPDF